MIIWSGKGAITFLLVAAVALILNFGLGVKDGYAMAWGLIVGGILSYPIGVRINRPFYVEDEIGDKHLIRPYHSLFFIKTQYWAFIGPLIGIMFLLFVKAPY